MKKTGKKGMSILMALCMLLALIPQLAPKAAAVDTPTRTTALDLTSGSVTYENGTTTVTANPTTSDITDSAEGWIWYLNANAGLGYPAKALVLDGLNLETSDATALKLPTGSTIVLSAGSLSAVRSTYASGTTYGIYASGNLNMKGSGTLTARGGNITSGMNSTCGIFCQGPLVIEDGSVSAMGGDCVNGYSYGIKSPNSITIQDGSVNAQGGNCTSGISWGVYSTFGSVTVEGGSLNAEGGDASNYSYGIQAYDAIFTGGSTIAKAGTSYRSLSVYGLTITATGMAVKRYVDGVYSGDVEYRTEGSATYTNANNIKISLPVPSFAESGDGSADDPYEIENADQLKELSEFVNTQNDTYGDKHYKLTDDIVLNESLEGSPEQWTPIGADEEWIFTGVFDGNGYTISGLYINDTEGELSFEGLFGAVWGATVKNLGLTGGSITAGEKTAVGGIVASGAGVHIENCYNACMISAAGNDVMAGGIMGVNSEGGLTVINCYNTGSVTVAVSEDGDEACAGGIVGLNIESSIRNCYSTGLVTGNASGGALVYAGGIVGQNDLEGEAVIEKNCFLDSSAVNGIGYDETEETASDAGCAPKSDIELKAAAFVQTLNDNVAVLEDDYPGLSAWRAADISENGGYPVFGVPAATYALAIAGGGTGAAGGGDYEAGTSVPISAGTRNGYTFSGWTTSGGGTFAGAGSADTTFVMPGAAVTITANWTENSMPSGDDAPPPRGGAQIIVNGQSQRAGTSTVTTDSSGRTTTTVTVDTSRLRAILDAQEGGATVIIPVTGGSGVAAGTLTGAMVKRMENKDATLVVQTDYGSYTLPASQINIDAVSQQLGENVSLSDITVTVSISEPSAAMTQVVEDAAEDGGFVIMVPAAEYTITCEYGGRTVEVSSFNAYVERTIAIPEGVDPARITTGVVVDPDGTVHHVPTRIMVIDGKYYAVINSLTNSTYSVIWNPVEFSDVATNHWAKDTVNNMGSRMVVSGTGNNRYEPERNMTRAEFAAIIVKALGLEPESGETGFHDVFASDWYGGCVKTASSCGIINGYENGNFGPNDAITREQAMTMLARAMKLTGLKSERSETSSLIAAYADGVSVSDYAKEGVAACLDAGIITGRGNSTIAPKDCVTRAEVAVMVERLLKNSGLI